jgi:hypothetical protein
MKRILSSLLFVILIFSIAGCSSANNQPQVEQTLSPVLATKYAGNTEAVLTESALPTKTPTPGIPPQTPPCQPGNLKPIPYGSMGAGGTIEMGGGIINSTTFACYLQSWPDFSLVDAAGNPLDIQYERKDEGDGDILLFPGQLARLNFAWGNWCEPPVAGGVFIRLTLPDPSGSIDIPPGGVNSPIYAGGQCGDSNSKSIVFSISRFEVAPTLSPEQATGTAIMARKSTDIAEATLYPATPFPTELYPTEDWTGWTPLSSEIVASDSSKTFDFWLTSRFSIVLKEADFPAANLELSCVPDIVLGRISNVEPVPPDYYVIRYEGSGFGQCIIQNGPFEVTINVIEHP